MTGLLRMTAVKQIGVNTSQESRILLAQVQGKIPRIGAADLIVCVIAG